MMRKSFFILPFLLFALSACPNPEEDVNNPDNSTIPSKPEDFKFYWHNGGGMINMSFNCFISEDSAVWTYDRYGYETKLKWIPSKDEIEQFYDDLKSFNFNKISSDCEGEVFDRGGDNIEIEVGGKSYEIDNSGNCFIKDKFLEDYLGLINTMHTYLDQEISKQMIPTKIVATESLLNCGFDVKIRVESNKYEMNLSKDSLEYSYDLYPGYNQLTVVLNYKDSTNYYGSPANFKYEDYYEIADENTKSIIIDWVNEEIVLRIETKL